MPHLLTTQKTPSPQKGTRRRLPRGTTPVQIADCRLQIAELALHAASCLTRSALGERQSTLCPGNGGQLRARLLMLAGLMHVVRVRVFRDPNPLRSGSSAGSGVIFATRSAAWLAPSQARCGRDRAAT